MRTIRLNSWTHEDVLHIEAPGYVINIRHRLKDCEGRNVVSVTVTPDRFIGEEWDLADFPDVPEYIPRATPEGLDEFTTAYLDSAEWCGIDDEEREAFEAADDPHWSADAIKAAKSDCDDFRQLAGKLLDGIDESQAGHDFWLTRNRHGAGLWDRGLGLKGDALTNAAHAYGEAYVLFNADSEELGLA